MCSLSACHWHQIVLTESVHATIKNISSWVYSTTKEKPKLMSGPRTAAAAVLLLVMVIWLLGVTHQCNLAQARHGGGTACYPPTGAHRQTNTPAPQMYM